MILKASGPQNINYKQRNDHIIRHIKSIKDCQVMMSKFDQLYRSERISFERNEQSLNTAKALLKVPEVFKCRKNCKIKEMCDKYCR